MSKNASPYLNGQPVSEVVRLVQVRVAHVVALGRPRPRREPKRSRKTLP